MSEFIGAFKLHNGEEIVAQVEETAEQGWFIRHPKRLQQHNYVTPGYPKVETATMFFDWIINLPPGDTVFLERREVLWSTPQVDGQMKDRYRNVCNMST